MWKLLPSWVTGLAWLGLAWLGLAWLGLAWLGLAAIQSPVLSFAARLSEVCTFFLLSCRGKRKKREGGNETKPLGAFVLAVSVLFCV